MNYNGKIRLTANWIEDPTINKFTIELDLYDKKIISNWELFGSFNLYEINPKHKIISAIFILLNLKNFLFNFIILINYIIFIL